MERLTEKDKDYSFGYRYKSDYLPPMEHKLGQHEDIEEELGIELITLFKALKNGIWTISLFHGNEKMVVPNKRVNIISIKEKAIAEWYRNELNETDYIYYYFKDYDKTWALTKEELE